MAREERAGGGPSGPSGQCPMLPGPAPGRRLMSVGSAGRTSGVMARTGGAVGAQGEAGADRRQGESQGGRACVHTPASVVSRKLGTAVPAFLWSVFRVFCTCCFPKSVGAP